MKPSRLIQLIVLVALVFVSFVWLWWSSPRQVDMAQYAPADALIFIECNSLGAVMKAITQTDDWKEIGSKVGLKQYQKSDEWFGRLARFGIGPTERVIIPRAQIAIVMFDLKAAEENTTLRIRPEGAMIIETHTSHWRIAPLVEKRLQQLADKTYGPVTPRRFHEDADYIEWDAPVGERKIVATIDQSVVFVGNSKRAVQMCLETRRGKRPSLRGDTSLNRMRSRLDQGQALTFGYVSSAHASRLIAWWAPLLLGRSPGDSTLEQILNRGMTKVVGPVGWSSRPLNRRIQDQFSFDLEPATVSRLRPAFTVGPASGDIYKLIPNQFVSLTVYRPQNPAAAWQSLRGFFSQFDALSAVLLNSIMKTALVPYGIEDSDQFLMAVGPEIATVKINSQSPGSVLIARAADGAALKRMFKLDSISGSTEPQPFTLADRSFAATIVDNVFLVGPADDVRACLDARQKAHSMGDQLPPAIENEFIKGQRTSILTVSDDSERVRNFFSTILSVQGRSVSAIPALGGQTFAITETTLTDDGIDRSTLSAFGQFSTLASLMWQSQQATK